MSGSPALDLSGIDKSFTLPSGERLDILRGLDLVVDAGEIVAIVGRSGSGKSTLLNLIGLLDAPNRGSYRLDGVETTRLSERQRSRLRGERLGFIFQQFHLLDRRSTLENVAEPLLFAPPRELAGRHARAAALLERVGLVDRAHSMPHLLSGGEQQRVAIARALVRNPRVVLADEPTGALDQTTGALVLEQLTRLAREEGVTLILVTHDPAVANRADRVLTLREGRLVADALTSDAAASRRAGVPEPMS